VGDEARAALQAGDIERALACVVESLERLERRVALLEQPPEPDPLVVGTEVFRQTVKTKDKALRRA
jgi:hypothetical protein